MQVHLENMPQGTKRLRLLGLAGVSARQLDGLGAMRSMLDAVCCAASVAHKDYQVDTLTYELPATVADAVLTVAKHMLEQQGVAFEEGFPS